MCGIFGAVSSSQIQKTLLSGLSKLEYRGYDSAGISLLTSNKKIKRIRCTGKVKNLKNILNKSKTSGICGLKLSFLNFSMSNVSIISNYD